MSRHRNFRGKNFADENEDYDEVYGHSYDDNDYSISPETSSQFLYDRSKNTTPIPHKTNDEPEDKTDTLIKDINKAKLYSCLESIQDIIGESISEDIIIAQILKNNFDSEKALSSLLTNNGDPKPYVHTIVTSSHPTCSLNSSFLAQSNSVIPKPNFTLNRQERFTKLFSTPTKISNSLIQVSQHINPDLNSNNNFGAIPNTTSLGGDGLIKKLPKFPMFSAKLPSFKPQDLKSHGHIMTGEMRKNILPAHKQDNQICKESRQNVDIQPSSNVVGIKEEIVEFGSGVKRKEDKDRMAQTRGNLKKKLNDQMCGIHDMMADGEVHVSNRFKLKKGATTSCPGSLVVPSSFAHLLCNNHSIIDVPRGSVERSSDGFGSHSTHHPNNSIYEELDKILAQNYALYSYTEPSLNLKPPPPPKSTSIKVVSAGDGTNPLSDLVSDVDKLSIANNVPGSERKKSPRTLSPALNKSPSTTQRAHVIGAGTKMMTTTTTTTPNVNKPSSETKFDAVREYAKLRTEVGDNVLNVIVIGHVDAGKSTLMGHLLYLSGNVMKKAMHKNEVESKKAGKGSFAYAWVLDETNEERSRGITMDVAQRRLKVRDKVINLIDAPGHKDFIPNMINGTSQAEAAILVVDATSGEFETGFESGGQTREHALLARSLGISQMVVAVNKMDNVKWSQDRFRTVVEKLAPFFKQIGFKENNISYVPCSGLLGQNVAGTNLNPPQLNEWWSPAPDTTLLGRIENFQLPERAVSKPFRFVISDVYKSPIGSGICLCGKLESGAIKVGDKAIILPPSESATIKSIRLDDVDEAVTFAGDNATIIVTGCDVSNLSGSASGGLVMCPPSNPIPLVHCIEAKVLLFNNVSVPITLGFNAVFHYQTANEPCVLTKLISVLNKTSGEVVKSRPRVLVKNCSASVEITFQRPICLELYSDSKELGRFTLRHATASICAGIVTKIVR